MPSVRERADSQVCHRRSTLLTDFRNKGYFIAEAKVNFVVWWKDEDADKEIRIVLPELHLVNQTIRDRSGYSRGPR